MSSSSYGAPLQNGATHDDVVVGEHDPLAGGELGLDRGAEHAAAGEAGERPLLVEDLAGHERQAEDLAVRVGERRAGLAAVVDDRPACSGRRASAACSARRRCSARIELGGVRVVELVEPAVVVGREHEHLVDAAGLGA